MAGVQFDMISVKDKVTLERAIMEKELSVLVNGTPAGFFPTHRGLHHWDPLSPLLFISVMEALSRLLDKVVHEGLQVNLRKPEMIPVRKVERLPVLAAVLGCKKLALPTTYLDLPLGASLKVKGVWEAVV
ncbi:uncharacterized protein LOC114296955 [Camellia sinensis]|uniref:uncharacterized protein LOC114296955 n=1 Tax=Camellia sinensis TaxID=4442 RepID=UPI001036A82B|nr:uncharacterized protein LOC114296955 [Camellia sinensis]